MSIRRYHPDDAETLWELVFNTVHHINSRDYSDEQIKAWAPAEYDMNEWQQELCDKQPLVLCLEGKICGYADLQNNGHINHFFVAHDRQREGKGSYLIKRLFSKAQDMGLKEITVEASITARPFFEHHGFSVVREEKDAYLRGQKFTLFFMKKKL